MPPNFPTCQQTGLVSEQEVALNFSRWGWTAGKDFLDTGIDLFVEADKSRYFGARFLVQVKGTVQKNRRAALIAPVDKSRLAEYVRNPHPVFLMRVSPNGKIYWLHVQEWAKSNHSRLSGSGTARIPMDPACDLSNREGFEAYLDKVMTPASQKAGALALMAVERMNFLNTIDPRFRVQVNVKNGSEEHEIFAVSESASADISFQANKQPDNVANLKESIEFGLPRKVEVSEFRLSGSPLFDALGANSAHTGMLTIQAKARKGCIRMYSGRSFSLTSHFLEIEAELFSGHKGVAISSHALNGLFQVEARYQVPGPGNTTLEIRQSKLTSVPIQYLTELATAGDWAEQVAKEQAMFPELFFDERRARLPASEISLEKLGGWLFDVKLLSRLHLIAKYLDSDFVVPTGFAFTEDEASEINFAYHLLRGERLSGGSASMVIDPSSSLDLGACTKDITGTTSLILMAGGHELGALPIAIEMPGYTLEPILGTSKFRVHHPEGGDSWITHDPEGNHDVFMRRSTSSSSCSLRAISDDSRRTSQEGTV